MDHSKRRKSIVILVCYFGKLPWYFNYFIHSCRFNATIDFILICDSKRLADLPGNVRHVHMTLSDVNTLASKRLSFKTNIQSGYKFCDFKPAYGYLFDDYITDYDFWGQSDIDVILGDIRSFMDNEVLSKYDYISVRHDFPTGCFSIFRNNLVMNTIFMRSKDAKKVLSSDKHYCFDECNNVHDLLTSGKSIFELETEIESFMHIIKKAERDNEITVLFDLLQIEGVMGRIKFNNGKLVYRNRLEAILYHMIAFKLRYRPKYTRGQIPNQYNISPRKIYWRRKES